MRYPDLTLSDEADPRARTLTLQPSVVSALSELADDLTRARRCLAELGGAADPEARAELALRTVVHAPVLASAALPTLRASGDYLSNASQRALDAFVDKPTSPRRAHRLGRTLADDGHYQPALTVLHRAQKLLLFLGVDEDALQPVRHEIGFCLGALGRHEEALDILEALAADGHGDDKDALPHAFMGHTLLELGRMADARAAFQRAMALCSEPSILIDTALFVEGSERLLEFEGQRGGLDARDLHYVHTAGIVLSLCGEDVDGVVRNGGYHAAGLELDTARIATILGRCARLLDRVARARPSCVVPLHNVATPLSLAVASLLGVPHCSDRKLDPWERPLLVGERLSEGNADDWVEFVDRLPDDALTFALVVDWTAEALPVVDVAGVMAASCVLPWEHGDDGTSPYRGALDLVRATRSASPRARGLERYYRFHQRHRLA